MDRIPSFTMKRFWCALIGLALLNICLVQAVGEESVTTYTVHGVLRGFDPATGEATISHEAIPGYMGAMTMSFRARGPKEFDGLSSNDLLEFQLCVTSTDAWIQQVKKIGVAEAVFTKSASPPYVHQLLPGDAVPDLELTDHEKRKLHLSDLHGQAVAITFVYTRCPLPTYCPLTNRNFKEAQNLLQKMEAGSNWQLVSITLDPEHDTPEQLANFAQALDVDEKHWVWATAPVENVRKFGSLFGLEFHPGGSQITHNLRTVVVDPQGRLSQVFSGNQWTPQELASAMRKAMDSIR